MRERDYLVINSWTFKHVHAFSFSNLNTPIILLDKEKVYLYYVGLPFCWKWKLTIHIFMDNHISTNLPEWWPTKYPSSEPCF